MRNNIPTTFEGEPVRIAMRSHPIVLMPIVLASLLVAALSVASFVGASSLDIETSIPIYITIGLLLAFIPWAYLRVFTYLHTMIIITDKRLVEIKHSIFHKRVSELEHGHIQDVSSEVKGIFPTMLNLGTVTVQTAGEFENFVVKNIHRPYKVVDHVMSLVGDGKGAGV